MMHSDTHDFECLPDCNNKLAANNMKSIHNRANFNVDAKFRIRGRV